MDEELKYDKCAHTTDGIMHGIVPLEDTSLFFGLVYLKLFFCSDIFLIMNTNR